MSTNKYSSENLVVPIPSALAFTNGDGCYSRPVGICSICYGTVEQRLTTSEVKCTKCEITKLSGFPVIYMGD